MKDDFNFSTVQISDEQKSVHNFSSVYKEAWNKFIKNKPAIAGVIIILAILVLSVIFSFLPNWDTMGLSGDLDQGFSNDHWFGTDSAGRDFWSRCWAGVQYSVLLAFITTILNVIIAIIIGLSMGYFERFDKYFSYVIKIMYALPTIIILILFSVVFEPTADPVSEVTKYHMQAFAIVIFSLVFSGWVNASQQIRGVVIRTKNLDFITASQTLGTNRLAIMKVFFAYALPVTIVQSVIIFPRMIISESILGFLGLSVPDLPTLGNLINDGRPVFLNYPRELFIPIAFLAVTTVSIQLIGFGVEDAFLAKEGM